MARSKGNRVAVWLAVFALAAGACGGDDDDGGGDGGAGDTDAGIPPSVGPELPLPDALVTYYVSSSLGDDSWSGTLAEPNAGNTDGPKASIEAALALINGASPGTHVLLRAGDTWTTAQEMIVGEAEGTEQDPIILGSYGTGAQPTIVAQHQYNTIVVRGNPTGTSQYFRVHDLRLETTMPSDNQVAIYTGESFHPEVPHHLTFSKLTIEDNGGGMILYGDGHLVHGCRIAHNNLGHGIYMHGNNLSFQYNEFEDNGLPPPDVFVHSLYIASCDGVLFEHNVVHSATDGVKVRQTSNGVFRYNTFHGMEAIGIHLGGDATGGAYNNRIESNLFYDNAVGIVIKSESGEQTDPVDGLVIANNIMRSSRTGFVEYGYHLIVTEVPAQNVSVVNNLLYGLEDDHGLAIANSGANIQCANNIVGEFDGDTPYQLDPNVSAEANLTFTSRSAFDALALTDPAAGDFTPTAGSTMLIDQGVDVSGAITADYDGTARPAGAAFDIGPYERVP